MEGLKKIVQGFIVALFPIILTAIVVLSMDIATLKANDRHYEMKMKDYLKLILNRLDRIENKIDRVK